MNPLTFDRALVRRRRGRATSGLTAYNFLFDWAMHNLIDRLELIKREFPRILQLGTRCTGAMSEKLMHAAHGEFIVCADQIANAHTTLILDEEHLPFAPASFDLIISPLSLHNVNDLPGALIQLRRALKPDGLLLAALPGGATLHELRASLLQAEIETSGGASPRVAPFADRRQLAELMQRAGFALPVVDGEKLTVSYPDTAKLYADLRGMGETNTVAVRAKNFTARNLWRKTEEIYRAQFVEPDGRLPATFEIIFLLGWVPHASQPQPLKRGSATISLGDALNQMPA